MPLLQKSRILEFLAQMVSGALVYYAGIAIYDLFSEPRYAELPTDTPVIGLMIYIAVVFTSLVVAWNRVSRNHQLIVALPLGIIILLPLYIATQSFGAHLPAEVIKETLNNYLLLPGHLLEMQITPQGWALDLVVLFTTLSSGVLDTIHLLNKREQNTHP
jgi:hypothetical protein